MKRQDELTRRIQCRRAKAAKRSQKGRQREKGRCTLGYLHTGDLRAVQDFLGHADPRMTAKYAHVVDMAKKNPALFIPVKVGGRIGCGFVLLSEHATFDWHWGSGLRRREAELDADGSFDGADVVEG